MEKTPEVISVPMFFSSKPNRNEFLKCKSEAQRKNIARVIKETPAIFRIIKSDKKIVIVSGRIEKEILNAGFANSNKHNNIKSEKME